ncbi:MAG TPA: hypothetical protein VFW34_06930 [Candidatus Rubrimentiphilum sp.]|nr:hypothetical protein [Candidatus Rubrimentiphilum sp.]
MSAKRLIIVTGSKGGTGKSLVARYLADRYEREGVEMTRVDADADVAQLHQYYDDTIDLHPDNIADILSIVESARSQVVLLDMPGRGLNDLAIANREASIFEWLEREGVKITMLNVLSPFRASTASVRQMLDAISDTSVKPIALLNRRFGPSDEHWALWTGNARLAIDESPTRTRLREQGGQEVFIPEIRALVPILLDLTTETFQSALHSSTPQFKTAALKQYLRTWLRNMDAALRPIEKELGL